MEQSKRIEKRKKMILNKFKYVAVKKMCWKLLQNKQNYHIKQNVMGQKNRSRIYHEYENVILKTSNKMSSEKEYKNMKVKKYKIESVLNRNLISKHMKKQERNQ